MDLIRRLHASLMGCIQAVLGIGAITSVRCHTQEWIICCMKVLWQCPESAEAMLVLAHGAGAGMAHRNLQALADAFGRQSVATLRFDFPFIEAGRKRVDSRAVATAAIAEACAEASRRAALPLWLGGHSFGGRMASHAVIDEGLEPRGLIFCSFPLHPAGKPSINRAAHLQAINRPMLFLSGTRD
ncbi:MAG TPA: alpha/beta fold hydrolase, partial [Woeseiaceae bacterium]|nr:alpha/beta fold hydrolase [Woeseiaceae bacterium]